MRRNRGPRCKLSTSTTPTRSWTTARKAVSCSRRSPRSYSSRASSSAMRACANSRPPSTPGTASAASNPGAASRRRRRSASIKLATRYSWSTAMLHIPISRWGEPYKSLDLDKVVHFASGEVLAEVSRANGGLVERDMRHAQRARQVLREIPIKELLAMVKKAGELYVKAELPLGDGTQNPDQFVRMQSATTGLPEHMCRFNREKNLFVLSEMERILDSLTRGLDLSILTRGYGVEPRGVPVSYQVQSPVLGMVLPSNSPGVHTLWLPIIPLQIGLVLKPGPQEPWTPYRMTQAFLQAGVPKQAIAIYPGLGDVGAAVLNHCPRSLIFGGSATVEQYKGNPRVQAHGPGFSKIILGDDQVDNWQKYLDIMVDSVLVNSGRGCINCSGIWVSKHGRKIAEALAERMGPIQPLPPEDPKSALAAFTVPGQADAVNADVDDART